MKHSPSKALKITFALLEIDTYHNSKLLKKISKPNGRIHINKPQNNSLVQIDVMDNIAFPFSFWFEKPSTDTVYKRKMLQLPRPLIQGFLEINTEKLILYFTIDEPDRALEVKVQHTYTQLLYLAKK